MTTETKQPQAAEQLSMPQEALAGAMTYDYAFREPELSVKLTDFEGPLDLLLHLVKENKIEIKDIFMSQVTEQFLSFMQELGTVDVDKAGEYMEMVATLMEIKSRLLLPVLPQEMEDEESPEKILIRQLEEYNMLKEASQKLKEKESTERHYKEPSQETKKVHFVAKDMSLDSLLDAFANLLSKLELKRLDKEQPKQIKKDSFSVADKMTFLEQVLLQKDTVAFSELFGADTTVNEVIVTFSAMLELIKLQKITVRQDRTYGEIKICRTAELNGETDYGNIEIS